MFRVGHQGEGIDDADTIEGAREIVRADTKWKRSVASRSHRVHTIRSSAG
jgi:hypothetical protein